MAEKQNGDDTVQDTPDVSQYLVKDADKFALNLARMVEAAGQAAAAWTAPRRMASRAAKTGRRSGEVKASWREAGPVAPSHSSLSMRAS